MVAILPDRLPEVAAPSETADPALRLVRYPRGVLPSTLQIVRFADGRTIRTDLIRLNPCANAYSLDFDGRAPRHLASYGAPGWQGAPTSLRGRRHQIEAVLRASDPLVKLSTLSGRLRAAGVRLGHRDVAEHEAIAATQAVLWHVTDGLHLDTQARHRPTWVRSYRKGDATRMVVDPRGPWFVGTVEPGRPRCLEFELPGRPQLGAYAVALDRRVGDVAVGLERLGRDGRWAAVPGSGFRPQPGSTAWQGRTLGPGTTSADGFSGGYARYRLVISTQLTPAWLVVGDVRVSVTGSPAYANPLGVVGLYHYLLSAAENAPRDSAGSTSVAQLLTGCQPDGRPVTPLVRAVPCGRGAL